MEQSGVASRSRFGCVTCRRKHRKCDEQRPTCKPCQLRGLECHYQITLKWADSHDISTFDASLRQRNDKPGRKAANSAARRRVATPPPPPPPPNPPALQPPQKARSDTARVHTQSSPRAVNGDGLPPRSTGASAPSPGLSTFGPSPHSSSEAEVEPLGFSGQLAVEPQPGRLESHRLSNQPKIRNLDLDGEPAGSHNRYLGTSDQRREPEQNGEADFRNSYFYGHTPSYTGTAPYVIDDSVIGVPFQVFDDPSEEIAFMYYVKRVSTCTTSYDSPKNPYRKLAVLSLSYPVLLHGILSVSTGHMHNCGRSNEALLSSRQARALNSLRAALNALLGDKGEGLASEAGSNLFPGDGGIFSALSAPQIALAAVLMQTSSVLMTGIGSVEVHLKCALEFIRDLGYLHRPAGPVLIRLLIQRFAMVDVVLAHLRFRRPLAPLGFFMYQNNDHLDWEEPSFREMHGCPQRVMCFLVQISCLSADLAEKGGDQHSEIQSSGYILETEMRAWGHKYHDAMAKSSDINGSIDAASVQSASTPPSSVADEWECLEVVSECFYWAAHLLLLRRVFLDSTRSVRVKLIRSRIFRLMDRLRPGCGPDSSLPFPFYMAAREAVTSDERDWVRHKHAAMMEVYRERSREHMMASTEEIWKQADQVDHRLSARLPALETPYEQFIRSSDRNASYFMF